ncbi:hypothetical protein C8J55DRAFT_182989 [Lentinula edodes]|uniref:Uncharacterized protein n=1 Tax=Lentinula lateritia TaxID=40482 RepID=A0A9W9A008_9AGAR|nr:hypothetical protein C8J55DRAFT_182989 [Lentinula edodes]
MFGLFRRISNSVLPRPDRPWDDDATSNAPKLGRKRRLSSTERDLGEDKEEQSRSKKHRGDTPQTSLESSTDATSVEEEDTGSTSQVDLEGVKEVTEGVKEVDLEDKQTVEHSDEAEVATTSDDSNDETVVAPESVPLPEEVSGELDDTSSTASTPPAHTVDENAEDASKQTSLPLETPVAEMKQRTRVDQDAVDDATLLPAESDAKHATTDGLKDETSA